MAAVSKWSRLSHGLRRSQCALSKVHNKSYTASNQNTPKSSYDAVVIGGGNYSILSILVAFLRDHIHIQRFIVVICDI